MRICIVGPGALGCLFAAYLAKAGHEIWLLDHRPERAARISAQGISLEDCSGRRSRVPICATSDPHSFSPVAVALLCVKSPAVDDAVRRIIPALAPDGLVVAFQNGIAHLPLLAGVPVCSAVGVTAQGAHLLGEGSVRHGGSGITQVGFLSPATPVACNCLHGAARMLTTAGIETVIAGDIRAAVWNKLIVNTGINALTVLENCTNGALLTRPHALEALKAAVAEAVKVARAEGVAIAADPVAMTLAVCERTRANISSMLQDIRAERKTEIEAINGEIVRRAERLGMDAPVNRALVAAVQEREAVFQA